MRVNRCPDCGRPGIKYYQDLALTCAFGHTWDIHQPWYLFIWWEIKHLLKEGS